MKHPNTRGRAGEKQGRVGISPVLIRLARPEWGFGRALMLVEGGSTPDGEPFLILVDGFKLGIVAIRL